MPATILIVDDEKHTREGLMRALEDDYDIFLARDADEAIRLLDTEHFDVVLTDLKMAGKSGMSVVDHALKRPYRPICIMMTAYGSIETAVEAMRRGAFDFMMKPVNLEKLEVIIRRALKSRTAEPEAGLSSTSFASQPSLNAFVAMMSGGARDTGIDFNNKLEYQTKLNIIEYLYYYNGGGIAIGDINNDGLEDIYFSGNQVPDRLYLNMGDLKFKDINLKSGIKADSCKTCWMQEDR